MPQSGAGVASIVRPLSSVERASFNAAPRTTCAIEPPRKAFPSAKAPGPPSQAGPPSTRIPSRERWPQASSPAKSRIIPSIARFVKVLPSELP